MYWVQTLYYVYFWCLCFMISPIFVESEAVSELCFFFSLFPKINIHSCCVCVSWWIVPWTIKEVDKHPLSQEIYRLPVKRRQELYWNYLYSTIFTLGGFLLVSFNYLKQNCHFFSKNLPNWEGEVDQNVGFPFRFYGFWLPAWLCSQHGERQLPPTPLSLVNPTCDRKIQLCMFYFSPHC